MVELFAIAASPSLRFQTTTSRNRGRAYALTYTTLDAGRSNSQPPPSATERIMHLRMEHCASLALLTLGPS